MTDVRIRSWPLGVASALLAVCSAQGGTLEVRDFQTPGDALLTLDTETDLEWLDITATLGATFSEALSEYEEFRHADAFEVAGLFTNAGMTLNGSVQREQMDAGLELLNLLGWYEPLPGNRFGLAMLADRDPNNQSAAYTAQFGVNLQGGARAEAIAFGSQKPIGQSDPSIGHWLVRDAVVPEPQTVPEPASLQLILGVLAAGLFRRRVG